MVFSMMLSRLQSKSWFFNHYFRDLSLPLLWTRISFAMIAISQWPHTGIATSYIHGISMTVPGLPYNAQGDVVNSYVWSQVYQMLEDSCSYSLSTVAILCKSRRKADMMANLIATTDILAHLSVSTWKTWAVPPLKLKYGENYNHGSHSCI